MEDSIKMFFHKTPPSNQFLCRAYLCQAQLNAPTSSKKPVGIALLLTLTGLSPKFEVSINYALNANCRWLLQQLVSSSLSFCSRKERSQGVIPAWPLDPSDSPE